MSALISARALKLHYKIGGGKNAKTLYALDGVDIDIAPGESIGLLGESGSGKSTLGKCLAGAHLPHSGSLNFNGIDMVRPTAPQLREMRRKIQLIFQDPALALNPRVTIGGTLAEHLRVQRYGNNDEIAQRIAVVLEQCGLHQSYADRYPHELSGGQRQRVVIARAISTDIEFVVADEPVSALDGSTRAQIINLFRDLHKTLGLASLIISHDISVLAHVCSRIAVMHQGKIVESAPALELLNNPQHPYTKSLIDAVPLPDPAAEREKRQAVSSVKSASRNAAGAEKNFAL